MSCNCIGESGLSISTCLKSADQCPHPGQLDVECERKNGDNRNGLETHVIGQRIEDCKGGCVREDRNYTCVLLAFIARLKLHRKKSSVFTLFGPHTRLNASADTSASLLSHQINTQSN